jgi:hypothetical protein
VPTSNNITFNERLAKTYRPKRVVKHARIIRRPPSQETVIDAEWGEKQRFIGTYVEVYDPHGGYVKYGSAYDEWIATNTRASEVEDGWYKSSPVRAYPSPAAGWLITTLADGTEETRKWVNTGDWLVRQQFGELMCLDAASFSELYDLGSGSGNED